MTLKDTADMSAVLFPHTSLPEPALKRILTLFRPLRVFVPWYLEEPAFMKPYQDAGNVQVGYPSEDTRPTEDFAGILRAYKDWNREHRDRGYAAFLEAQRGRDRSESSTWGIREELRRVGREAPPRESPLFLKWHLILHLAREMEEQRQEADRILENLKDKGSPLRGILDGEDAGNIFADLPHFQADPVSGESQPAKAIEAWAGLFGDYPEEHEVLVTFDRRVFEYVLEASDPTSLAGTARPEPPLMFEIPDQPAHTPEALDVSGEGGVERGARETLAKMIGDMGKTQEGEAMKGETPAGDVLSSLSRHPAQGTVLVTATLIRPPAEGTPEQARGALSRLTGKRMVLVEEVS